MLITTISSLFCSIPLLLICTGESGIFSVHAYAMEDMKDSFLQGVLFLSIKCFSVVVVACCSPSLLVSFVSSKHHLLKSAICLLLFLPWHLTFLFHVFFPHYSVFLHFRFLLIYLLIKKIFFYV